MFGYKIFCTKIKLSLVIPFPTNVLKTFQAHTHLFLHGAKQLLQGPRLCHRICRIHICITTVHTVTSEAFCWSFLYIMLGC